MKGLSWWVFHGQADNVVPPIHSEEIVKAMRDMGIDVRFSLYPDVKHDSWNQAFAEPDLLPWLFSHKQ
ncbi:prolyl oligopeptidase family serine peptidase [Aureitalea marina]|uniref:prolyl oligopeptidase family serine peptidase n=1 Tax=Aureitalea marina TaxID=930804 RepID=UPI0015E3BF80|nr:prolyl oligopeptidase family serine peptidase [Aureitalea marina]